MFFRQSPKQKKTLLHRTPMLECLEARLVPTGEFFLHSLPGATKRIFLDFDGHTTTNTYWNQSYGSTIITPAYNIDGNSNAVSATELGNIREIWERVSEDFLPFNVDVTTQDPGVEALRKVGGSDTEWGIRVCIGGQTFTPGAAGIAYLDSFTWASDTPAFVFSGEVSGNPEDVALIASHEVGHTLGLDHDGTSIEGYYDGHGQGTTSWGPLLGAPYSRNLTQWSKGEYADADNHEDDLAIITNATNGFGYRNDDHGSGIANASNLTISNSTNFNSTGIIERNTDRDFFRFNLVNPGLVNININPATNGPNLDIEARLYNANGVVIDTNNLFDSLNASISSRLPAGTYYISVDGAGQGDPLKSGYTDYGSLGFYSITGIVSLSPNPAISGPSGGPSATHSNITVQENNTQVFNFTADKSVTWTMNGGSDKSRFTINPATGALSFIASPDFENPLDSDKNNSYVAVVQATDSSGLVSSQSVTVTIGDVFDTKPIDTNGARVLSAEAIGLEDNIITGFKVKFSEPILPDSFTNADLRVDGPLGKITPGQPTATSADNTEFVFSIPKATGAGSYKLRVGVDVFDYSNNKMNNNGDSKNGEFIVDAFEKSFVLSSESTLQVTNSSKQSIKDQGTIISQINISENFKIKDLNVKVNASHTQDSDLVITLKAPNGQVVTLVNRRGGSGDNFTNTWFDDEATTAITSGRSPFTGSFKPEGKLSSLDGINAKGTWTLTISDKVKGNTGSLIQWSLKLTGNQISSNAMAAAASSPLKMAPISQPMVAGLSSFASVIDKVASGILSQAKSEDAAMAPSAENTFRGFQQDRAMNPGLLGSVQVKDQAFSQETAFTLATADSVSDKVLANIITDKALIWSAFRQN